MPYKPRSVLDVVRANPTKYSTQQTVNWFKKKIKEFGPVTKEELLKDPIRSRMAIEIGFLYMFVYDPKWKEELPYYDKFPLIFIFDWWDNKNTGNDGFVGINFHYLHPRMRVALMDALMSNLSNTSMDKTTKIKANWKVLSNAARYPGCRHAVKKYIIDNVQSKFIKLTHDDWYTALMLPVEDFQKASKETVWKDWKKRG